MNSLKTKTCKAALIADFISHFLCCNIMCSAQYCSLCHNFPGRHKEWKYNNKPEGRLCVFFPGICTITALPTNYLTAPPNPGYMTSYLRRNKWELCLTRNYVPGWVMRPRRDRRVEILQPCFLYNANEQCWNERLSLRVHAIQLLCSAFFPFVDFAVNYLSLL